MKSSKLARRKIGYLKLTRKRLGSGALGVVKGHGGSVGADVQGGHPGTGLCPVSGHVLVREPGQKRRGAPLFCLGLFP